LKRGTANYRLIETRIIRPILAGGIPLARGIDAIASARAAALTDPEGEALTCCLAEVDEHGTASIAAE
jgi:indolepyruvate ferredoxin oxidoreductase beta subunit